MVYEYFTESDILAVLEEVVDLFLIPKFMELKMEASGEFRKSIEVRYNGADSGTIRGRFYAEFLAKGRNPNRDQSPEGIRRWAIWAGSTFIKEWVQDKGLSINPIAVAYSIARKGTSWKRKGGSDLLEVLESPEVIRYIQERMRAIITPRVTEELRRNASILQS